MTGQGSPGVCHLCGQAVLPDAAFVNIGPTDWNDPSKARSTHFVPEGTDIHGWSPFVVAHPDCFARTDGQEALDGLMRATGT